MVFSPDGGTLAATAGQSTRTWDARTGDERLTLPAPTWVRSVAVSPDGRALAVAVQDGVVRVYGPVSGDLRQS